MVHFLIHQDPAQGETSPGSPTLNVVHVLGVRVVSGEERVMAEAAEAVGARGFGLFLDRCKFQYLRNH